MYFLDTETKDQVSLDVLEKDILTSKVKVVNDFAEESLDVASVLRLELRLCI
jgi:flagellar motor switch protein FliM